MNQPRDPETGLPLPPRLQPGYYPGYNTLSQQNFWDAATRRKILDRVNNIPPIRFFNRDELPLMELLVAHILPQEDRLPERRIPIIPWIDERLFNNRIPGYRFDDMPPDQEAYRLGLIALDKIAQTNWSVSFSGLSWLQQEKLLKSIHDGAPLPGAQKIWENMSITRYWNLILEDCCHTYYAHPWAWDEIGFGGPAYPRAYFRLEHGAPEPWEVDEKRYEWIAPANSLSDPTDPDNNPTEKEKKRDR